jgi:hypothetical protein
MNKPNFASVLDVAPKDIEKPKPLPAGTYVCTVNGLPKFDKSTKKGTDYAEFIYNIVGVQDDVDEDALKEVGGWQGKTIRDTYYLTENARYRLKEMLMNCGLDPTDYKTLGEMVESAPGCQLLVSIKHTPSADGTAVYANVAGTAPVE